MPCFLPPAPALPCPSLPVGGAEDPLDTTRWHAILPTLTRNPPLWPVQVSYQPQQQQQQPRQVAGQPAYSQLPLAQASAAATAVAPVAAPAPPAGGPPLPPSMGAPPPATCDWAEHSSAEGYKYYYNTTTGESRWEKPAELLAFEKGAQQPQPPPQQPPQLQQAPGLLPSPVAAVAQQALPQYAPQ
eukprot:jgi/Mesen1/5856/ME000298S05124